MNNNKIVTFDASQCQLVPKVPTDEMRDAGNEYVRNRSVLYHAWKAMLAASPTPAAQSAGQEAMALTDEQILAIAVHHFKSGYDSSPKALSAFCNCVRSVITAYAAPVNTSEPVPLGAIENGRVLADRLETFHEFVSNTGDLRTCSDWQEFRRCFEHLAQWAMHDAAPVNGGERDLRDAVTKALGLSTDGIRNGKPIGFAWSYLLGQIEALVAFAERAADAPQVGNSVNSVLPGWSFEHRTDDDAWVVTMPSGDSWVTFGKNPAGQLVAALSSPAKAAGDEWETIRVKNLQPLLDALARAEEKGYLPDAFIVEWTALEIDSTARPMGISVNSDAPSLSLDTSPSNVCADERGIIVLRNAVASLREFGKYVDEEGEDTDALEALCAALSADGGEDKRDADYLQLYRWLANRVLACDYGDNDTPGNHIGWRVRADVRDGEPFMFGKSIDEAIRAAIAANQAQKGE